MYKSKTMNDNHDNNVLQKLRDFTSWLSSKIHWDMVPIKIAYFFIGIGAGYRSSHPGSG